MTEDRKTIVEENFLNFKKLTSNAIEPTKNQGDAGYDLYAIEDLIIPAGCRSLVRTGLAIEIPESYYGKIAPRSGLAYKKGIDVMAGIIDSTYRGEIGVILINLNIYSLVKSFVQKSPLEALFGADEDFRIKPGDKIAQIIIEKYYDLKWTNVKELGNTNRGQKGFGSTGT
ncbi:MAG: dUTP diphosphatase [Nanoarchaeota archaeon]